MFNTIGDIDAFLERAQRVPVNERGPAWHELVDMVIDQRSQLMRGETEMSTRSTRLIAPEAKR